MNTKNLTVDVAKQFLENCDSFDLSIYESMDDTAAAMLAKEAATLDTDLRHLKLSGLTHLSDSAAEALAQYPETILLDSVTSLSFAASRAIARRACNVEVELVRRDYWWEGIGAWLHLPGIKSLSDVAIEELVRHEGNLALDGIEAISDIEAQILARHDGYCLSLEGLTLLSDTATAELANHRGFVRLGDSYLSRFKAVEELSECEAKLLAKHDQDLDLSGLKQLSGDVAKILADHGKSWESKYTENCSGQRCGLEDEQPVLNLSGLVHLSDSAAEALISHDCRLRLRRVESLSVAAAACLAAHLGPIEADLEVLAELLPSDVCRTLATHPSFREHWKKRSDLIEWLAPRFENGYFPLDNYCDFGTLPYRDRDNDYGDLMDQISLLFGDTSHCGNREIRVFHHPERDGSQYAFFGTLEQIKKRFPPFPITKEMADDYTDDPDRVWTGFTAIDEDAAEILAGGEGPLHLPDVTKVSATVASILAKSQRSLNLDGMTSLSADVAEALSAHPGDLSLLGVQSASDVVVETLASHHDDFRITGLGFHELPNSMAGILSRGPGPLHLPNVITLTPAVAAMLAKREGTLKLDGLVSLSHEAVESLIERKGDISLGASYCARFQVLSDAEAMLLAKHNGELRLDGLLELSDAAAEALANHRGDLFLNGIRELAVTTAESLAKHKGDLILHGIEGLSDVIARSLAKLKFGLYMRGVQELSDAAAEALATHKGGLYLYGLRALSDVAAAAFARHEGELNLQNLEDVSASAATALRNHKGGLVCRFLEHNST